MQKGRSKRLIRLTAIGAAALLAIGSTAFQPVRNNPADGPMLRHAGFIAPVPRAEALPSSDVERAAVTTAQSPASDDLPAPPKDVATPALPDANPRSIPQTETPELRLAAMTPEPTPTDSEAQREPPGDAPPSCTESLKVTAVPGGMAYLAFNAPCREGDVVTLSHAGLSVDLTVPPGGRIAQTVPVLDADAPFALATDESETLADARLRATPSGGFGHVVLQWTGPAGFQLHALEDGAHYGDRGHVWADAPRDVVAGVRGAGGFLTRLGSPDSGETAEIYSFPVSNGGRPAPVAVTVEVSVTSDNCGTDIAATLLQKNPGAEPESATLTFAVPGCDAVGDILVLKNILGDLTLARN